MFYIQGELPLAGFDVTLRTTWVLTLKEEGKHGLISTCVYIVIIECDIFINILYNFSSRKCLFPLTQPGLWFNTM